MPNLPDAKPLNPVEFRHQIVELPSLEETSSQLSRESGQPAQTLSNRAASRDLPKIV
jgi:hypothetical protein